MKATNFPVSFCRLERDRRTRGQDWAALRMELKESSAVDIDQQLMVGEKVGTEDWARNFSHQESLGSSQTSEVQIEILCPEGLDGGAVGGYQGRYGRRPEFCLGRRKDQHVCATVDEIFSGVRQIRQ